MKTKIAILTDSSSSIYNVKDRAENIFMLNSPAYIGEEMFTDFEKNLDAPFYEALEKATVIPRTSQPSVGETLEMFNHIKSLGYTDVIYLPISKALSGTYQNGHMAKEMVEGINITIVDTMTTVSILAAMTLEASRLANAGLSVSEIVEKITILRANSKFFAAVKDLTALIKNGRLSNAKGFVANLFNIRPVLHMTDDGRIVGLKNVRTFNNALKACIELIEEGLDQENGEIHLLYTKNTDEMEYTKSLLIERFPKTPIKVFTLPSTVVAHIGLESIAIGFINY